MRRSQQYATGLILISVCGLWTGCASKSSRTAANAPSTSTVRNDAPPPFNNAKFEELAKQFEAGADADPFAASGPSSGGGIRSAFHKASAAVEDAFTIEPKVVPADDPVRLSGKTPEIGYEVFFYAARMAEQQGNIPDAIKKYEKALAKQPDSLPTLLSFARLYDRQGEFQKAMELYQQAVAAHPENPLAHNDLGLCLARQKQYDASLRALSQAVRLEPEKPLYSNNLGTVLVAAGRSQEAWQQFAKVHSPAVAHYNVAVLLHQEGKHEPARVHLQQAIQLDPTLAPAREMLAQLSPTESPAAPTSGWRTDVSPPTRVQPASATESPDSLQRTPPVPNRRPGFGEKQPAREQLSDGPAAQIAATSATGPATVQAAAEPAGIKLRYPTRASKPSDESTGPAAPSPGSFDLKD